MPKFFKPRAQRQLLTPISALTRVAPSKYGFNLLLVKHAG